MSSVLYSTTCYIKNDLYRLSICIDDDNKHQSQFETDSSDFTPTDISIDAIIPSLTHINFELINDKKNTNIPKTIILNHLLSVQQTELLPNTNRKDLSYSNDTININEIGIPIIEQSQKTSQTTLNTNIPEVVIQKLPVPRCQFNFRRIFSTQSITDSEANFTLKTVIHINYVDISNSFQWNIRKLKLDIGTEDIANELYANLNLCLSVLKQRPQNLLAFVNPFGGKGKKNIFLSRESRKKEICDVGVKGGVEIMLHAYKNIFQLYCFTHFGK
jgi:hypothetical protein